MNKTSIPWCDYSHNPWTGCTRVSPGCDHCYAQANLHRFRLPEGITLHPERWADPARQRRPGRVFVCSMSDFFHEDVSDEARCRVLDECLERSPWHTYIILTKRAEAMMRFCRDYPHYSPRLWLGVTAENQQRAEERISLLLQVPAKVHFVSIEPMLGPVDLDRAQTPPLIRDWPKNQGVAPCNWPRLDWVIVGGENGAGARQMEPAWVYALVDQCRAAGVPFFWKGAGAAADYDKWGATDRARQDAGLSTELPRQFPAEVR